MSIKLLVASAVLALGLAGGAIAFAQPNPSIDVMKTIDEATATSASGVVTVCNVTGDDEDVDVELESVSDTVFVKMGPGKPNWTAVGATVVFTPELAAGDTLTPGCHDFAYDATWDDPGDDVREVRNVIEITVVGRDKVFHDIASFEFE